MSRSYRRGSGFGGGGKSKYIIFAFIALALAFEFDVFSNLSSSPSGPSSSTPTASKADNTQVSSKRPAYALLAAKNTWPPGASDVGIASNLLANNFYLVLDGSGSMDGRECAGQGTKMQAAKVAVQEFVKQIDADANVGLFAFDQKGSKERLALGKHDRQTVITAIANISSGGGTPLSSAMSQGYNALTAKAAEQLGYGEYHLVVVTDGEANTGFDPRPVVQNVLQNSPVVIHTIGFCISGKHSLNQQGSVLYKAADDPKSLSRGLSEILAEMPDFNIQSFGS